MSIQDISNFAAGFLQYVGIIISIATIFARLTKTKKDDNFIEKIRKFMEGLGNLFLPDRKEIMTSKEKKIAKLVSVLKKTSDKLDKLKSDEVEQLS